MVSDMWCMALHVMYDMYVCMALHRAFISYMIGNRVKERCSGALCKAIIRVIFESMCCIEVRQSRPPGFHSEENIARLRCARRSCEVFGRQRQCQTVNPAAVVKPLAKPCQIMRESTEYIQALASAGTVIPQISKSSKIACPPVRPRPAVPKSVVFPARHNQEPPVSSQCQARTKPLAKPKPSPSKARARPKPAPSQARAKGAEKCQQVIFLRPLPMTTSQKTDCAPAVLHESDKIVLQCSKTVGQAVLHGKLSH